MNTRARPNIARQRRQGAETTRRCWELHRAGYNVTEIALATRLTKGAVSKALHRGKVAADAETKQHVDVHRALALARLNWIYSDSVQAFDASTDGITTRRSWQSSRGVRYDGVSHTSSAGDPRFMAIALKALDGICRLLGLNAEPADVGECPNRPLEHVPDEELYENLERMLRKAKAKTLTAAQDDDLDEGNT